MGLRRQLAGWVRGTRLPFLQASILPVLLGAALAFRQGDFQPLHLALSLLGVALLHTAANLINEYYDDRSGADRRNSQRTPFSGGSGAVPEGWLTARAVFRAGLGCLAAGLAIGLYFLLAVGWPVLLLGLAGAFGAWCYTAPPLKLGYRGWGELNTGLMLGPLAAIGGYIVHTGRFDWDVVWLSLPVGLLVALILIINEFPDYEADRAVGKRHLIVILGRRRGRFLVAGLLAMVYLCLPALIAVGPLPSAAAWLALTSPLAVAAVVLNWRFYERFRRMIPAQALVVILHLCFGVGISAVLAWA